MEYKNNTVKTQRKADSAAVKEHFSQDAHMCGFLRRYDAYR